VEAFGKFNGGYIGGGEVGADVPLENVGHVTYLLVIPLYVKPSILYSLDSDRIAN